MELYERIRAARKRAKYQGKEAAKRLGIATSTLSNYENDTRKPNIQILKAMSELYNVPIGTLIEGSELEIIYGDNYTPLGKLKRQERIPILGTVRAGDPIFAEENILGYTDLPTEYSGRGKYFALYVMGDSMNNCRICDGDIIVVRQQENIENGEIAVVCVNDDNFTIKKVFFNNKDTLTLMPSSTNTSHSPQIYNLRDSNVKIVGKVVEVKIKL